MARPRVFLTIETRVQRTIADQRNAVVRLGSVQPCLHRRSDIDEDVLVLTGSSQRDAGGDRGSECRCKIGGDLILRPRAVDVVHVEAARRGYGIDIELERGLADVGAGVAGGDRGQIELNVGCLRGALDVKQCVGAKIRSGSCGVRVGIAAGGDLPVGPSQQN